MRLTFTIAKASLLKKPARSFFATLGIAMGIAVVVAIFALDHNTILGLSQPNHPEWRADLRVRPNKSDANPRDQLAALPGIEGVSAFFQNDVDIAEPPGNAKRSPANRRATLFAIEGQQSELFKFYRLEEGRDLDPNRLERAVLIGRSLANAKGLTLGDVIRLGRPRRGAKKACVDGVMTKVGGQKLLPERIREFNICGILAPEKLGRRSSGQVCIMDFDDASELFADIATRPDFVLKKKNEIDLERLKQSLSSTFSYELNRRVVIGQAAEERAFRNGVRFAGLMALGLGLYVIFHTLSIALVERTREIATLFALGATRGQISRIFLSEACILSTVGGVLGLGLGLVICRLLLHYQITTLGTGKWIPGFSVPWVQVLSLTLLGAGIALVGAVYPLMRMRKRDVAGAMRGERTLKSEQSSRGFRIFSAVLLALVLPLIYFQIVPVVGEQGAALMGAMMLATAFFALLIGLPLLVPGLLGRVGSALSLWFRRFWPMAGLMTGRSIDEKPMRLAVAVIVVAMVTAAFVSLKGMTSSLRQERADWAAEAINDKVFVQGLKDRPIKDVLAALAGLDEIAGVEGGDARIYAPFLICGISPDQIDGYGPLQDNAMATAFNKQRGIVLSRSLAQDHSYKVDDLVKIKTGRGGIENFKVITISDAYGFFPHPDERLYGVVADHYLRQDFCIDTSTASRIGIKLKPGSSPDKARDRIQEKLASTAHDQNKVSATTGLSIRDYFLWDVTRDFLLFDLIIGMTALLGALGILNGQLLAALERHQELGVMRALGATIPQMRGMVLLEALITGVIGGSLGIVFGSLLNPLVLEALELVSGLQLPLVPVSSWLLVAATGAVLVPLLAAIIPMMRLANLNITRALREG